MNIQSSIYDAQLGEIPHYRHYPEMMPFVGSQYELERLLVIGESHYLPNKSTAHDDDAKWYKNFSSNLDDQERAWIGTRLNVIGRWSRAHTIYRRIADVLGEAGLPKCDHMFAYIAFMNTFQRPAKQGGSMYWASAQDISVSLDTIKAVVEILQPKLIWVASSCAYGKVVSQLARGSIKVTYTCHPATPWWNRATGQGKYKDRILDFLKENLATVPA